MCFCSRVYVLFVAVKPTNVPRGGATSRTQRVATLVGSYLGLVHIYMYFSLSEYAHTINNAISLYSMHTTNTCTSDVGPLSGHEDRSVSVLVDRGRRPRSTIILVTRRPKLKYSYCFHESSGFFFTEIQMPFVLTIYSFRAHTWSRPPTRVSLHVAIFF